MAGQWGDVRQRSAQEIPNASTRSGSDASPARTPAGNADATSVPTEKKDPVTHTIPSIAREVLFDKEGNLKIREIALLCAGASLVVIFAQDNQAGRLTTVPLVLFSLGKCVALAVLLAGALSAYRIALERDTNPGAKRMFKRGGVVGAIFGAIVVLAMIAYGCYYAGGRSEARALAAAMAAGPAKSAKASAIAKAEAEYAEQTRQLRKKYLNDLKAASGIYDPEAK